MLMDAKFDALSQPPRDARVSKYSPLGDYLRSQNGHSIELSLMEIEQIIGRQLPASAYAPRWWTNGGNSRRPPLWQEAWRNAGYDAVLLQGTERVAFRRIP
jgi:hypothetical protein